MRQRCFSHPNGFKTHQKKRGTNPKFARPCIGQQSKSQSRTLSIQTQLQKVTMKFCYFQSFINEASKIVSMIKRTFTFLDKELFNSLYKALVQPLLGYGNVIQFPYLKRQSVTTKRVQRRATILISTLRDLSYTELLKKLDLPTLTFTVHHGCKCTHTCSFLAITSSFFHPLLQNYMTLSVKYQAIAMQSFAQLWQQINR